MLYNLLCTLLRSYFTYFWDWEVQGREEIPSQGGIIIVANHTSFWDPLLIGAAMPRQVYFMAKRELFRYPVIGYLIQRLGAFPVKRGSADRSAIRKALRILKDGGALGIFPEGTRNKTGVMQHVYPGAALLAIKAGVPVLPIGIQSRTRREKQVIKIGQPLHLMADRSTKDNLEIASLKIMREIEALLEKKG